MWRAFEQQHALTARQKDQSAGDKGIPIAGNTQVRGRHHKLNCVLWAKNAHYTQ
jgi:hypothetical protein